MLYFMRLIIISIVCCSAQECQFPSEEFNRCLLHAIDKISDKNIEIPDEKLIAHSVSIKGIKPVHYNLHFNYFDEMPGIFTANSSIIIDVIQPTKSILLNAYHLTFTHSIHLYKCGQTQVICPVQIAKDDEEQWLMVTFEETLDSNNKYILVFDGYMGIMGFTSKDEATSAGLWRNNFGSDIWATAGLFEMRGARKAFPCFDHPSLKAHFDVSITHDADTIALSNMEADEDKKISNGTMVTEFFKSTPKMSTYIVTFSVLKNFTRHVDNSEQPQLEILHANIESESMYLWQIPTTRKILKYLKDEIGLTYNLPKLAFLNVSPFHISGMENFGLVTLNSELTLNNDDETIRAILLHEIIHQWLGNLATISYWEDICLQEGLTTYLEWKISERLHLINLTLEERVASTTTDILNFEDYHFNREPIVRPYITTQSFITVCYLRPPVIFHMIAEMWGPDIWLKFIKDYTEKFAYSNANFSDWETVLTNIVITTEASDVLHSWFHEKGRAIINAKLLSETEMQFQQKLHNRWGQIESSITEKGFTMPVKILAKEGIINKVVFNGNNASVELENPINGPFVIDPHSVAYTTILYNSENYLAIFRCYGGRMTNPCFITEKIFLKIFDTFYYYLVVNHGSLSRQFLEDNDTEKERLAEIFVALKQVIRIDNGTITRKYDIKCAVLIRGEDVFSDECKRRWHFIWSENRVMKMLGRNYTFESVEDEIYIEKIG